MKPIHQEAIDLCDRADRENFVAIIILEDKDDDEQRSVMVVKHGTETSLVSTVMRSWWERLVNTITPRGTIH